ncbi:hypothetical protein CSOJ01_07075 [Colletotrichum sojae]|uniref:Uncharacterized protein n=1 Tax=Colletotrichum sojae TaxID=2175907 RepID=A0A8H6JA48_9PEZI|nr:hypothetical protein CSOJ01_07075 [Colletotrichum sojae]
MKDHTSGGDGDGGGGGGGIELLRRRRIPAAKGRRAMAASGQGGWERPVSRADASGQCEKETKNTMADREVTRLAMGAVV